MEIEVKNGSFSYTGEEEILTDISFKLSSARIMTILGQNGIGKTTLLKCILGILPWNRGLTLLDGEKMNHKKHMNRIGYVPQAYKFAFPYSVEETVIMGLAGKIGFLSVPDKNDREKAYRTLEEVGVFHLRKRLCSQLSGGQLQLVFIARGLIKDPDLMILDEPESHLDYKNQVLVLKMLEKLARGRGISCIINTHYPDHALRISDSTLMQGISASGEKAYIQGPTREIITEENIRTFFDVESRIITLERENGTPLRTLVITE